MIEIKYPPFDASQAIPNGIKEPYNIEASEKFDEKLDIDEFKGHLKIFPVGKYDTYTFWLDENKATGSETSVVRCAIYDENFALLREGSFTITSAVADGQMIDISFSVLELSNPTPLFIVFGRNDELNGPHDVKTACQKADSKPSIDLIFKFTHSSGAMPVDITLGRSADDKIYYSAIYKVN